MKFGQESRTREQCDVRPETCTAAGCARGGEALVEQYVEDGDGLGMQPSGNWIWLCGPHVVEEFS